MTSFERITFDAATEEVIRSHLMACGDQFEPPLKHRVDIPAYARKIREHALTVEAWQADALVGLVAAYLDVARRSCFVTNVSVLPELTRRGIASALMSELLREAINRGMRDVVLEVSKHSVHAASLYARLGFAVTEERADSVLMMCAIGSTRAAAHEATSRSST